MGARWQTITVQSNLIKYKNDRSYLIKMPKSRAMFWYSAKLVKIIGKNGWLMEIAFTDNTKFKLFYTTKTQAGYKNIDLDVIDADDFEQYMSGAAVDYFGDVIVQTKKHIPEQIEVIHNQEVLDEIRFDPSQRH